MTRPNSVTTNYAYDNLSRLQSVLHQLSGSTIDGASYTLDSAGNRTAKTDQRAAVTSNYTYDAIYELTKTMQGTSTTESYSYDPVGNRTASLGVSSYTTNASNEMTANSNASYTYDSNGNTLTKTDSTGTTTYAWDFENRVTSVTLPGSGGTITFKYDPYGRRIYKSSALSTSIFEYDDGRLIEETNASGGSVARYSQTESIDEPLAMVRGGVTSFYDADGLGSITSLSNSAGTLAQTYALDSFGKLTASAGSVINPFLYTAREFDTETNLYFYRARYYDPAVGRYVSQDEIGNDDDSDLYRYVKNNALNLRDPTGLYKLIGFPPDLQQQMNTAIRLAIIKITTSCTSCAAPDGPSIVGALAKATFVYKPDLSACAATYHGANRRIEVGPLAFNSGRCCDLASTLAHEADHYGANATEPDARAMEKKCFNCGTGQAPPSTQ